MKKIILQLAMFCCHKLEIIWFIFWASILIVLSALFIVLIRVIEMFSPKAYGIVTTSLAEVWLDNRE